SLISIFKNFSNQSKKAIKSTIGLIKKEIKDLEDNPNEELQGQKLVLLYDQLFKLQDTQINKEQIIFKGFDKYRENKEDIFSLEKKIAQTQDVALKKELEARKKILEEEQQGNIQEGIFEGLGYAENLNNVFKEIAATTDNMKLKFATEMASDVISNFAAAGGGFASGGWIGAIVAGVTDLVPKIVKWANANAYVESTYYRAQKVIDETNLKLKKLGIQMEKNNALQNNEADLYSKNSVYLLQQLYATYQQIEEKEKELDEAKEKDTPQIQKDLDALNISAEDLKKQFLESKDAFEKDLLGTDSISLINNLADAWVDAWQRGEDTITSMKDVVKKMIKNIIIQLVASKISEKVQKIWDALMPATGDLEDFDAAEFAKQVNKLWDDELPKIDTLLKPIFDGLDMFKDEEDGISQDLVKKGFGAMTQDTAEELNGRFTAIQVLVYEINNKMNQITTNSYTSIMYLSQIADNTRYCENLFTINQNMQNMKINIADLQTRGILIRNN
ncbi:MAG: hypothetical protein LBV69_04390, partial [Bacteroidales bacterium]|nr:hypothetical protein [Bacteroidales bacterium]